MCWNIFSVNVTQGILLKNYKRNVFLACSESFNMVLISSFLSAHEGGSKIILVEYK
jgi:hypothetical protein